MNNTQSRTLTELTKDLSVLYVEDSDIVRESTCDMMEEFFTHIDVAEDGVKGLQKYKKFYEEHQTHYDIVFTDINMPNMNGIEMSTAILEENKAQNIVVISAHNESEYLLKLINIGISNFILKPIDITQFEKIIFRLTHTILNEKALKEKQKELLEMNRLLQSAKKEAEQASLLKSQFLANMSHEIRTPLNAITGFISLLHEKEANSEKLKYFKVIQSSSDSLLQIINDILDISKIESGKMELDLIDFNPYEDLITLVELFQGKASQKGVIINIKYDQDIPDMLYTDVLKIKQILSNLLSNAVKFTPKDATIKCTILYTEGHLNIQVKDQGIGIPKEKQEYIFEAFSQAEGSTVREFGGTGLGLTICAKLTKILSGTLTLHSHEGKGSTFELFIPMRAGREKRRELPPLPNKPLSNSGHILLVEDNEANRMFIGIVLDNAGIAYETANNGIEAVEKFKKRNYALILMDENMPKLSGIGATKAILDIENQQELKHTPIISLTANAFSGDRERFLEAGMDDYLSKPIEPSVLIDTIQKYL